MAGNCILCGKCLSVCPLIKATNREELGPRTKSDLCRLLDEQPGLLASSDVKQLAGLCLGCYRCKAACSQGQDVPGLVAALRGAHPDLKAWLWKIWLSNADKLWAAGSSAANLIPKELQAGKFGRQLRMLAGLKGGPGLKPFLSIDAFPDTYRGEKMLVFAGCTATFVQSRWLMAALRLLDGLGADVLPGDFQCCGGSLKGAGFANEAKKLRQHNVEVWRKAGKPRVVTFCASCKKSLAGYEGCFLGAGEAAEWSEAVTPLAALMTDTNFSVSPNAPKAIGYHHPCHAGDADPDGGLLKRILGDRITATDRECCGFGGILRLAAPELGDAVNADCWRRLGDSDVVVTGCSACATQLKGTAPIGVGVGHWLEIVSDAALIASDADYGQCQD